MDDGDGTYGRQQVLAELSNDRADMLRAVAQGLIHCCHAIREQKSESDRQGIIHSLMDARNIATKYNFSATELIEALADQADLPLTFRLLPRIVPPTFAEEVEQYLAEARPQLPQIRAQGLLHNPQHIEGEPFDEKVGSAGKVCKEGEACDALYVCRRPPAGMISGDEEFRDEVGRFERLTEREKKLRRLKRQRKN